MELPFLCLHPHLPLKQVLSIITQRNQNLLQRQLQTAGKETMVTLDGGVHNPGVNPLKRRRFG